MDLPRHFFSCIFFLFLCSCSGPEILIRYQEKNSDSFKCFDNFGCREDEICIDGKCVSGAHFPCQNGQTPLLDVSSQSLNFGSVKLGQTITKDLTITNLGNCTLVISNYFLDKNGNSNFSCPKCEKNSASILIAPTQSSQFQFLFSPKIPGKYETAFTLVSNDFSINPSGEVRIQLKNELEGKPKIVLQPSELVWGYIPYTTNQTPVTKTIRIANFGTLLGSSLVESIAIEGDSSFSIPSSFMDKWEPVWLEPALLENQQNAFIDVPIVFVPQDFENHQANIVVTFRNWGETSPSKITARLNATSKGQPKLKLSHDELLFRSDSNEPVLVGSVVSKEIQITNVGESELLISDIATSTQNEFSFFPSFLPIIFPGKTVTVHVFFAPNFVHTATNSTEAFSVHKNRLFIKSNDPQKSSAFVGLFGWTRNVNEETLMVEMSFENAQSGWSGDDFRNVDLELISPTGFSCTKPKPIYSPSGNLVQFQDYCKDWNKFAKEGQSHWISLGTFEKPERITLYGLNSPAHVDQIFTARVHYIEDCSYMPSALLANLLGIGTSLLTSILANQAGATTATSPSHISNMISKNCVSHAPTLTTIRFLRNGLEIASPQVLLYQKGDFSDVMKIHYRNNHFEVN